MKTKIISLTTAFLALLLFVSAFLPIGEVSMGASFGYSSSEKEDINFDRRVETYYMFEGGISSYTYNQDNNACGPVAGSEILGYYDKLYANLLPNYTSSGLYNGKTFYQPRDKNVDKVTAELITLMNSKDGTTEKEFQAGLTSYVKSKGLKTTYTSTMNTVLGLNISFNFDKYKAQIDAGVPVFIGMKKHHIVGVSTSSAGKFDRHYYMYSNIAHAVVGCGYSVIKYYRTETKTIWSPVWYNLLRTEKVTEEVNFRTDTFLIAATGSEDIAYININKHINITSAFSVKIHS